jgi:hypothetical protein
MTKDGSMRFTGMDGIGGVVGIGMENMYGFMDGFDDDDGCVIWRGSTRREKQYILQTH